MSKSLKKKKFLERKDVAKYLDIKISTVYSWTKQGKLDFGPYGRIKRKKLHKMLSGKVKLDKC